MSCLVPVYIASVSCLVLQYMVHFKAKKQFRKQSDSLIFNVIRILKNIY